jgi:hypothetical protein
MENYSYVNTCKCIGKPYCGKYKPILYRPVENPYAMVPYVNVPYIVPYNIPYNVPYNVFPLYYPRR